MASFPVFPKIILYEATLTYTYLQGNIFMIMKVQLYNVTVLLNGTSSLYYTQRLQPTMMQCI